MSFPAVSADYIIDLYGQYLRDPKSVDASWRPYFDELWGRGATVGSDADSVLDVAAARVIDAYRLRGHFAASLDPLRLWQPPQPPELDPAFHGIEGHDLDRKISLTLPFAVAPATPRALLARLRAIYCGSIGFDCAHVDDSAARVWLFAAAESGLGAPAPETRRKAAHDIIRAHEFEHFFSRRFIAKKRFGADGAEAMVAWFDALLARSVAHGVREVIIGGTARGRLNVMANVIEKPITALLHEFKGHRPFPDDVQASSDVPYHFGYVNERSINGERVSITYCHNPSHLEAIDGVALGRVRARQDMRASREEAEREVLGLLVHTDAAFAGQGLVAEVFQLSQLPAYSTGGTVHIVINNQVGFTTDPKNGRTSIYCTDVARTVGAPVLHVNADDVDAVVRAAALAADYRNRFKADIVVDLVCYRRFGHNELDEPTFTQPQMYRAIVQQQTVYDRYIAQVVADGVMSQQVAEGFAREQFKRFDAAYHALDGYKPNRAGIATQPGLAAPRTPGATQENQSTGVSLDTLRAIGEALSAPPAGVTANEKVVKQLRERGDAVRSGNGITWAFGEALAFASLACEGCNIRFSGQDSPRGAFSQRHFVLVDQETGESVEPFNMIQPKQGRCRIIGSPLSEYSVLGFEYGYSLDATDDLVVWEAQFGDFANVAQVIFDQFISSGEDKWLDASALTVMLPHGLEGQGPDHSSGRIERFLQMCAGDNMKVANCSTPANLFHLLRRQALTQHAARKPLLIFTTKSLLRHRAAVSTLSEFGPGMHFQPVIGASANLGKGVRKVIICSGKVYYDLAARLNEAGHAGLALVRLEQLYPFPERALRDELARYPGASVVWCQEEPENMGAWSYVDRKIEAILRKLGNACEWPRCVSRRANASTAIGTNDEHNVDQARLVARAIGLTEISHEKGMAAVR